MYKEINKTLKKGIENIINTLAPVPYEIKATVEELPESANNPEVSTFQKDSTVELNFKIRRGEKGEKGDDGTSFQYIYRLYEKEEDLSAPESNPDGSAPSGWSFSPIGISEKYPIEYTCQRSNNGYGWTAWSIPTIWSKWGDKGVDGAGVEYIFRITSKEWDSDKLYNEFIQHDVFNHPSYQEDDFYPGNKWNFDLDWTDEPSNVGPEKPLEWVSIRRSINGIWGEYSKPALWGKYAQDGFAYKTSYVFTRKQNPDIPSGGTYNNPIPNHLNGEYIWTDTVPEGNGDIWMSYRTFYSGGPGFDSDWSVPVKMSDTTNFQVEFSKSLSKPIPQSLNTFYQDYLISGSDYESEWRESEHKLGREWIDTNTQEATDAIWMATASLKDGVWSDWNVVKIKGEKGDAGKDGRGLEVEGTFKTLSELKMAWNKHINGDTSKFVNGILEPGDAYYVGDIGKLYIYNGGWTSLEPDTEFDVYWVSTDFKGEPGDSAFAYIRYSDDGASFTGKLDKDSSEGTIPGKYIGFLFGIGELDEDTVNDPNKYKWQIWQGEDGWGYEQIFLLTSKNANYTWDKGPDVSNLESQMTFEFLPAHNLGNLAKGDGNTWSDRPITPSEEWPFCWVVTRRTGSKESLDWVWKGDSNGRAHLYDRYTFDGVSAYHLELSNDQAVIPLEGNVVDPDFTDIITTQMSLYAGDVPIKTGVTYTINNTSVATCDNNGLVTLNNKNLSNVNSIICTATYNGKPYDKTFYINKTAVAYEIIPSLNVIKRDSWSGYPKVNSILISVKKWNGTDWTAVENKELTIQYYNIDGTIDTEVATINGDSVEIQLSDKYQLESIRFSIIENNNELVFETVGVIADGIDGSEIEYIYYLCNSSVAPENPTPNNLEGDYQNPDWHDVTYNGIKWEDTPSGISSTNQYEYVSVRKKKEGKWDSFSDPKLWSKWSEDGKPGINGSRGDDGNGIESITEYYLSSPESSGITHDTSGWTTTIPTLDDTNRYLWNYEEIKYTKYEATKTVPIIIGTHSKDGVGIDHIIEYYSINNDSTNSPSEWREEPPIPTSTNKYLWNYEEIYYTNGDVHRTEPAVIGVYQQGPQGAAGKGITSIVKKYALGNNSSIAPSSFTEIDPSKLTTNYDNNRFIWCEETTVFTDGESNVNKYIVTVHGAPGATGTGTKGAVIYPAGVWNGYNAYTITETKVPYVYLDTDIKENRYWILKKSVNYNSEGTNPQPMEGSEYWERMDSFDAIYSDIGVFNSALVGSFVFAGDYVFSQEGVGSTPDKFNIERNYKDYDDIGKAIYYYCIGLESLGFLGEDAVTKSLDLMLNWKEEDLSEDFYGITTIGWFRPNVLINAKTGKVFINDLNVRSKGLIIGPPGIVSSDPPIYLGNNSLTTKREHPFPVSIDNPTCLISWFVGRLDPEAEIVTFDAGTITYTVSEYLDGNTFQKITGVTISNVSNAKFITEGGGEIELNATWSGQTITLSWDSFECSPHIGNLILEFDVSLQHASSSKFYLRGVFTPNIAWHVNDSYSYLYDNLTLSDGYVGISSDKSSITLSRDGLVVLNRNYGLKVDSSGVSINRNGVWLEMNDALLFLFNNWEKLQKLV